MADNWRSRLIPARRRPLAQPRDAARGQVSATRDFDKPIVGVASLAIPRMNPCNAGIQPLVDRADGRR